MSSTPPRSPIARKHRAGSVSQVRHHGPDRVASARGSGAGSTVGVLAALKGRDSKCRVYAGRGSPSTRWAMMFLFTCVVPPAMV